MPAPVKALVALTTLVATLLGATAAAHGAPRTIGSGVVMHNATDGFAWQVRVERKNVGGLPGLCLETDHSWDAQGTSFGNVSTRCVAGRKGNRFSLHVGDCRGVYPAMSTASLGDRTIRKLAFALDRRARTLRIRFPGGPTARVRARRAPRALRLPVRFAWHMDVPTELPARVTAYNAKRKVVGRWKRGSDC
jgi:hypothetical protein